MKAYSVAAGTQERHRGPTMAPLALRNAIAGLQRGRWHSGTSSRAYNGHSGTSSRAYNGHSGTPSRAYNGHSGMPFPGRNGSAGTQGCHSRDGMGPLALRNAIPETEWGRWRSGTPFPGRNGSAGAQECHSRDGMGPLAWPLMLNNKKLMSRYSRLLKKIRVFVTGL